MKKKLFLMVDDTVSRGSEQLLAWTNTHEDTHTHLPPTAPDDKQPGIIAPPTHPATRERLVTEADHRFQP